MTVCPPPPRTASHTEYRRRARRIRSVYATQPTMRVAALRELARRHDANEGNTGRDPVDPVVPIPTGAAQTFAQSVRERMEGPVLRYTHRTRLIREAEQRGIGRFEANLIIAAVQHQRRSTRCEVNDAGSMKQWRFGWMPAVFAFAATQSVIAIAVWWTLA